MPLLDWDDVSSLEYDDYSALLSGESRALIFCALGIFLDRWRWTKESQANWDAIEATVSKAINEVAGDL